MPFLQPSDGIRTHPEHISRPLRLQDLAAIGGRGAPGAGREPPRAGRRPQTSLMNPRNALTCSQKAKPRYRRTTWPITYQVTL
jgi:hypothetical protein